MTPTTMDIPETWKPFVKPDALAERTPAVPLVTGEQLDLIKRTVANGATADELKLYLFDCARQGVHPLDKLIHFTVHKSRDGSRKYTPVTSIDFMRVRAAETNEYAGSDDAVFSGASMQPDFAASVTVWRMVQSQRCPFTATARWSEYKPAEDFMWKRMPHTMLAKCAEALALRKGFPRQLAGLYAREEMAQAGPETGGYTVTSSTVTPETPQIAAKATDGPGNDYRSTQNTAPTPDLPAGTVRIEKVDTSPTKNPNVTKAFITLSTGEVVTTIKTQLIALCEQLAQDNVPVVVETKKTKWGEELVNVHRADVEIQLRADRPVEPLTADDVPF